MRSYYILNSKGEIVQTQDIIEWGRFFEGKQNRTVAYTRILPRIEVSTVFLGIDHNFWDSISGPILFETMVFGTEKEEMYRYRTWREALLGHQEVVEKLLKAGEKNERG